MNRLLLPMMIVALGCHALAAEKGDPRAADRAAVRDAVESYVDAFHRQDAAAVAAHWTEDGEFLPPPLEGARRVLPPRPPPPFPASH